MNTHKIHGCMTYPTLSACKFSETHTHTYTQCTHISKHNSALTHHKYVYTPLPPKILYTLRLHTSHMRCEGITLHTSGRISVSGGLMPQQQQQWVKLSATAAMATIMLLYAYIGIHTFRYIYVCECA